MTATTDRVVITEPGVYDIPEHDYHADPVPGGSLSSSGARKLLPPSCPARFKWEQENPGEPTDAMADGSAIHNVVLEGGDRLVVLSYASWKSEGVKAAAAQARAEGKVPILERDVPRAYAMADAVKAHPLASALLSNGRPEVSLFAQYDDVWVRCRLDWLPALEQGKRLIPIDYKTIARADNESCRREMGNYGYHQQAAWNADIIAALGLAGRQAPAFGFVFQEKAPPYLVNVVFPDDLAMTIARDRNAEAIEIYRECRAADRWPGYSDDQPNRLALPAWAERY